MYPVDYPAAEGSLFSSVSEDCMAGLGTDHLHGQARFQPPQASKVEVTQSNMVRLQVFEDQACFLLALHASEDDPQGTARHASEDDPQGTARHASEDDPQGTALHASEDNAQVVALHLHGRWWTVDDVLKTSQDRSGLVLVQSEVERVILFLLSQRVGEKLPEEETVFSPHPRMEMSKMFWLNKEAVGFYTVKQKGSLCDGCTSQSYVLPVLDTVLVRAHARRRGLGLQMLEDFCSSFPSEVTLGVSAPISDSMAAVCRKYLQLHPSQRERLYEVEPPGGWGQRRNIWLNIQLRRCANDEKNRAGEKRAGEEESRRGGGGESDDLHLKQGGRVLSHGCGAAGDVVARMMFTLSNVITLPPGRPGELEVSVLFRCGWFRLPLAESFSPLTFTLACRSA
ncbi:protein FAM169B-like [Osmerus eperlanus]|uniref:protein FAM169B-like n=1 Tax=Osmerus eperlanus TaxID=29151 RepID=UPI002E155ECD